MSLLLYVYNCWRLCKTTDNNIGLFEAKPLLNIELLEVVANEQNVIHILNLNTGENNWMNKRKQNAMFLGFLHLLKLLNSETCLFKVLHSNLLSFTPQWYHKGVSLIYIANNNVITLV